MMIALILALCIASAVLGRLLLTREEAWRTITVRVPALAILLVAAAILTLFGGIFGVMCIVGGSFYGLYTWWLPALGSLFENTQYLLNAIWSGSWE